MDLVQQSEVFRICMFGTSDSDRMNIQHNRVRFEPQTECTRISLKFLSRQHDTSGSSGKILRVFMIGGQDVQVVAYDPLCGSVKRILYQYQPDSVIGGNVPALYVCYSLGTCSGRDPTKIICFRVGSPENHVLGNGSFKVIWIE